MLTLTFPGSSSQSTSNILNSTKYPKENRPEHLQDDEVFNSLTIGEVTLQLAMWSQTRATQEATAQKAKKREKKDFKTNTMIKMVKIEAGEDDATTTFHPQRYSMRPPVSGISKIWKTYPTHWPEVYYSVDLSDVGLDNVFGQKQLEMLHDRRSPIKVKMFISANGNIGRGGYKSMTLKTQEDGSTNVQNKDDWLSLSSVNEIEQGVDNLVAAYICFWEGDRSMATLRLVMTKHMSFACISNTSTRLRLLEAFVDKVLEINQRKAIQTDVPLTFLEVDRMAEDFIKNVTTHVRDQTNGHINPQNGSSGGKQGGNGRKNTGNTPDPEEQVKRMLEGKTVKGKKFCIEYQLKDSKGNHKCRDRKCRLAHACGFCDKFTKEPCGRNHSKFEHFSQS